MHALFGFLGINQHKYSAEEMEQFAKEDAAEEAALAEKQKRLLELKLEVENFINSISEKDLRRILRLKFITGLTISEIRSSMYLSRPGVYRLYEKAIDEAAKVFHSVER